MDNEAGNYISAITKADGTKLEQKDNGANSGWMYTLNGIHPDLAVNEQYLEDGDIIVFHYTDDYTKEHDHIWSSNGHLMKMHTGMNALTSGAHVTSQTTQRKMDMENIPLMKVK